MSGELQSGLPKVVVSTLKRPAECLESDETPESKKHHSAEESGSQLVSHANGGDPEQTSSSGNFHPRLVEALSQVPYSPLFGILWPIIIEQASFETRDILREVNPYFEALCHPYRRSDRAKSVRQIPQLHDVTPYAYFHSLMSRITEIARAETVSHLSWT